MKYDALAIVTGVIIAVGFIASMALVAIHGGM